MIIKNVWLLFFLALSYGNTVAANDDKKALELKNYFWKACSKDFKVTEVPEKWKDKSAVVIARSFEKYYKKRRIGGLEYFDYEHFRVKIQSKKALEEYAEFSFPESATFGNMGIKFYAGYKVIKPNGKEIEVPLKDAVVSEMKVNRYQLNVLKLAIPNLEIGDIVDFYIAEQQNIPAVDNYESFDPSIYTLVDDYPIMKQIITFDVERKCYLNAKSLNGAPKFVKQKKGDNDVYVLEDEDRDSYEDSKWMYPYRQLPTIKFKVVYAKGAITYSPLFLGQQGVLKNKVSRNEVVNFVEAYLNDYKAEGALFHKKIKKRFKGRTDKDELAKEIYYTLRNEYIISNVEAFIQLDRNQNQDYNYFRLIGILSYVYDQFGIKNKIVIGVPRSISTIEDIILENEITCALKLNNNFIVGDFDNYSNFGEYSYALEGTKAYEFKDKLLVDSFDFPTSKTEDNNINKALTFTSNNLDDDLVNVEIKSKITGHLKIDYQYQLLDFYDYQNEEKSKYKMEPYSKPAKKNAHAKYTQKKEAHLDELKQSKLDYLKAIAESNYDLEVKEVKDFVITSNGRHHKQPAFEFNYKADFEDVISKAGNNYLIAIGKLLDAQFKLEKEDLTRDYDIYMPFPRSFDYKIVFNIPEGYQVEGLDNLNTNATTDLGGFTSEASISNNQLIVKAKKYYTTNFVAKENWDDMKTFLKAAEDFNEKSILLKELE